MRLIALRRRLLAAQIVREFMNSDDKELKSLRLRLKRPIMEDRWRRQREARVMVIENKRRSSDELLKKREDVYQRYLEADRQENSDEAVRLQAKVAALDWAMGASDEI